MTRRDIADRVAFFLIFGFVAWGVIVCALGLVENLSK